MNTTKTLEEELIEEMKNTPRNKFPKDIHWDKGPTPSLKIKTFDEKIRQIIYVWNLKGVALADRNLTNKAYEQLLINDIKSLFSQTLEEVKMEEQPIDLTGTARSAEQLAADITQWATHDEPKREGYNQAVDEINERISKLQEKLK